MLEFQWPLALILLPLPWLVRRYATPAANRSAALHVSFLERLERISAEGTEPAPRRLRWSFILLWLLLVCAATRPEWLGDPLPMSITGRDMMLAVDLSGSMEFRDLQLDGEEVDRLTVVKAILGDFIERRHGDRMGLILFASQAYVQAPLTHDRSSIHAFLDESFIGLAGRTTAIGDAIGLAIKRLEAQPADQRVLLLITDGANNAGKISPVQAARLAADQGIRIFTVGVGADSMTANSGLFSRDLDPSVDLDEGTLQEIALLTGGEYFRARDENSFENIYHQLDLLEPALRDSGERRAVRPLYPWPLGLALVLSLSLGVLSRRGHAA